MKTTIHKSTALLLALCLLAFQAMPAFAQETGVDVVFCEDALVNWLDDHEYIGGTVTLGNNITITQGITPYTDESAPITINTGAFGLTFNGGSITDGCGFLEIIGEGVNAPVVDVVDMGWFWMGNWNNYLQRMKITAVGKDGTGGTALRISAADESTAALSLIYAEGLICSYGTGAIGLELAVPMDAYCFRVEVDGENSVAASAPNGANLYYCKLSATGAGSAAACGGDIVLDTCAAAGETATARIINRKILDTSGGRLYLPIKQNAVPDMFALELFSVPAFFLNGGEGFGTITEHIPVNWDGELYYSLDTSTLGKTAISGTFDPPFQGLGLTDDYPPAITADVRDPNLPCISRVDFHDNEWMKYAYLEFWESYDPADENLILWRSDDGETWVDFTHSDDIEWHGHYLYFYYDELTNPVMFQLEYLGKGESNVVTLSEKDGVPYGNLGGDRTGTDRNGVNTGDESSSGDGTLGGGNHDSGTQPGGSDKPGNSTQPGNENDPDENSPAQSESDDKDAPSENNEVPAYVPTDPDDESLLVFNPEQATGRADSDPGQKAGEELVPSLDTSVIKDEKPADDLLTAESSQASANEQLLPDPRQSAPAPDFNTGAAILLTSCVAAALAGTYIWRRKRAAGR